jgi:cell division protein FtsL
VALVAVTIFGTARVTLTAQAAAAAIESGRLNSEIKAERLVGDLLECDKSALSTPSRIECIAGESLKMAEAPHVAYLELPASTGTDTGPFTDAGSVVTNKGENRPVQKAQNDGFSGMLASVMEMATSEAEVLLVGDAGLVSTR